MAIYKKYINILSCLLSSEFETQVSKTYFIFMSLFLTQNLSCTPLFHWWVNLNVKCKWPLICSPPKKTEISRSLIFIYLYCEFLLQKLRNFFVGGSGVLSTTMFFIFLSSSCTNYSRSGCTQDTGPLPY